ncbi:metal-sensing transcriptional repressor [Eubacteriales bacterium OttesenSCG-928-N14]|nr:metal-sensing transcriptional repressor [Eubacteriales bacterium OttesenSCG-928-N14]
MKADEARIERMLKTARGQIDGILKMVEEDRYCVDISNQILATQSILNKVNHDLLRAHLDHCVRDAFEHGAEQEKIDELLLLFDRIKD